MSPTKFQIDHEHHARRDKVINGPRPSPLRINKDSHSIHKPSSSSYSSISNSASTSVLAAKPPSHNQPVIIYTHSPKIIHTQARDFMALVQKLTGLSRSNDETAPSQREEEEEVEHQKQRLSSADDNESSSAITEENSGGVDDVVKVTSSLVSPMFNQSNRWIADMPLFTPNSSEFFFSPNKPCFRYLDTSLASPNVNNNSISPPVLEFFKGLPEY